MKEGKTQNLKVKKHISEGKSYLKIRSYQFSLDLISLKSANETQYWLGLLRDGSNADKEEGNLLFCEVTELENMIAASVLNMKGKHTWKFLLVFLLFGF